MIDIRRFFNKPLQRSNRIETLECVTSIDITSLLSHWRMELNEGMKIEVAWSEKLQNKEFSLIIKGLGVNLENHIFIWFLQHI